VSLEGFGKTLKNHFMRSYMTGNQKFPSDLLFVAGLVILTDIFVLIPALNESIIRTALSLPLVIFLPGYALISMLFPKKTGLEGMERIALSIGLSVAVVSLIGLVLNFTTWGIKEIPLLTSLSIFTLLLSGLAYVRRRRLPEDRIFDISFRASALNLMNGALDKPESKTEGILKLLLVISFLILIVVGTFGYMNIIPHKNEQFTEFYILGSQGMADNYTTEYVSGGSGTYIVGITNNEYRTMNYTLEVRLENQSLPLPTDLQNIRLAHNTTLEEPLMITPSIEGKNLKLEFLLFNETEKKTPYRDLRLWINVANTTKANVTKTSIATKGV
jgi:uncharacterized membrane protein